MEKELSQFLSFIQNFVPLEMEDVIPVLPHVQLLSFEKKEEILGVGQKCKGIYFVTEGLFRIYRLNEGNDVTVDFMGETEFFTDYESLMMDKECQCYLETIEKTRLLYLPYDKLLEAYNNSHMLERLGRLMVERALMTMISRSNDKLANLRSEQKYANFEAQNKEFINRIPLKHLASFLGIAPESLSRIRRNRVNSFS